MHDRKLLWVDARLNKAKDSFSNKIEFPGQLHICNNVAQAIPLTQSLNPDFIIFDFDYADITGLKALRQIRENFPLIPLLMLAEQHYENLSIWALRCRVWDYLIKPFNADTFAQQLDLLVKEKNKKYNDMMWQKLLPSNKIPSEASIIGTTKSEYSTRAAINYMENHLHEKITAEDVSKHCGLSRFELSRAFKSEYSLNFRDFLLKMRMTRAERMLRCTKASVTEIAISVGFNDLSNFTRKFHKLYECSPVSYRRRFINTQQEHINNDS